VSGPPRHPAEKSLDRFGSLALFMFEFICRSVALQRDLLKVAVKCDIYGQRGKKGRMMMPATQSYRVPEPLALNSNAFFSVGTISQ
jgi:hypothetical protein